MRFEVVFQSTDKRLQIDFTKIESKFAVGFNKTESFFVASFGRVETVTIREEVEYYEGSYIVTPAVEAQTLETAKKFLVNDVEINQIPYFNVSNTSGGSTVYIGKEI